MNFVYIGLWPFTTVSSAVKKKKLLFQRLSLRPTADQRVGARHSGYENAFNLPQPVNIVANSVHVTVLFSTVTYCVKTYPLKLKHAINVYDKSYIL